MQIKFIVGTGRCTLLAEWLIGDQLAMAIQALTNSLPHSPLAARRKWEGGSGSEKKAIPEIQQTTEKEKSRVKNGEEERRHHNSASRRYTRRQEAKQGKEKNRSDLKSSPT